MRNLRADCRSTRGTCGAISSSGRLQALGQVAQVDGRHARSGAPGDPGRSGHKPPGRYRLAVDRVDDGVVHGDARHLELLERLDDLSCH